MRFRAALTLGLLAALATPSIASSAAVRPSPGKYSGSAGPFTISFTVSANRKHVTSLTTNWDVGTFCSVPVSRKEQIKFPSLKIHKGSFHGSKTKGSGKTAQHVKITVKFSSATTATGTIKGNVTIKPLPTCRASSPVSVKHA